MLKKRLYEILEVAASGDRLSRIFDIFIISLISLNVLAVIFETIESLSSQYKLFFRSFEIFSVAIFSIEYILRITTCTSDKAYKQPLIGRIKFALKPLIIIDLMAIAPFYLPFIFPFDLRFIRAIRLFRIIRLFKISRYSSSLKLLGNVFKTRKEDLFITAFMIFILLIISSSLMYFVERDVQPELFSSIPDAMWWGVATLTTVGYGDVYPVTKVGKLIGAVISILGIGMFALPAAILGSGFIEEIQKRKKKSITCPHCGKEIHKL